MDKEYAKKMLYEYGKHGSIGPKWYQSMHLDEGLDAIGYRDGGDYIWPRIRKLLPEDLKGKRILDIGCNAGVFCIRAAQEGAEVVGIEHDQKYLDQANFLRQYFEDRDGKLPITYIKAKVGFDRFKNYKLHGENFDAVLGISVIYHLYNIPSIAFEISEVTDLFIGRFSTSGTGQQFKLKPFTYTMKGLGFNIVYNDGRRLATSRFLIKYERDAVNGLRQRMIEKDIKRRATKDAWRASPAEVKRRAKKAQLRKEQDEIRN